MLIIRENIQDEAVVCTLEGRLDNQTSDQAQKNLGDLQQREPSLPLILDMSGVDYISSAGLRVLLISMKTAKANSSSVIICAPSKPVEEILEISGFNSMLSVHPNLSKALAACRA